MIVSVHTNGLFLIFDICGSADDGVSPLSFLDAEKTVDDRRGEVMERFLRLSGIEQKWVEEHPNNIVIEFDSGMFNFKLPFLDSN